MADALTMNTERLGAAILDAMQAEIAKIAEEEANAAAERVRQRTRERIPQLAASLLDHYSIERMGRELIIRVKHEEPGRG